MNGVDIDNAHPRAPRGPYPSSRLQQMRAWFEANPGEVLTADDVAERFDCTRDQAMSAMHVLRAEGLISSGTCYWLNPERGR